MPTPRVARINVTPVKSTRLHHPSSVEVGRDGARDDRRFLLVDDGLRLYNGKRDTSLVRTSAAWDPATRVLALTLPSGETLEAEAVRAGPEAVEVYGREVRGHVVAGPWADALSDIVGDGLAPRDTRLTGVDAPRRRRRPPVPHAVRVRRARGTRRGGLAGPARADR